MDKIGVMVVDDHPLMRDAICSAIEAEEDMQVTGAAADGFAALELVQTRQVQVAVVDLLMPGMDGLETIAALRLSAPQVRVLVLTSSTEEHKVLEALRAGASGYLLKDAQRSDLMEAIRQVQRGGVYLPQEVAARLVSSLQTSGSMPSAPPPGLEKGGSLAPLTDRQAQILELLGQGASNQEIAQKLVVSEATIRSHIFHLASRLGLKNREQVAAYAARIKE
jgi:DNA-binding NarL/FixJ family response regulator